MSPHGVRGGHELPHAPGLRRGPGRAGHRRRRGSGGPDSADAQYSKYLLLVWGVMNEARRTGHAQAGDACRGYELLTDVQRHAPGAVEAVLRHPSVGAWAGRALRALSAATAGPGRRRARPAGRAGGRRRHQGALPVRDRGPGPSRDDHPAVGRAGHPRPGVCAGQHGQRAVHAGGSPGDRGPPADPHPRGHPG